VTALPLPTAESEQSRGGPCTPRRALEAGLTLRRRRPTRIVSLERQALEARSTYPIERLRVRLDSGERLRLIFKRLHHGRAAKGNRREVLIYRRLLARQPFGAPALYASVYDDVRGHYWLFLEDLGERTLNEGDLDDWLAAVRWLAQMHGTCWGRETELRGLGCLDEHGPLYYWSLAGRARRHLVRARDHRAVRWFDRLMARFDSVVDHLVRQSRTLVHGDVFPHNVLLQPGPRIRPIDWESAAVGLGAWDLTRLLDGWGEDKPALRAAYLSELARHSPLACDPPSFEMTVAHCEVLDVLRHLAWEAKACAAEPFVLGLLQAMECAWHRLDYGEKIA
jgi:aminoglycoside/choline kinase family phosphotransferase